MIQLLNEIQIRVHFAHYLIEKGLPLTLFFSGLYDIIKEAFVKKYGAESFLPINAARKERFVKQVDRYHLTGKW